MTLPYVGLTLDKVGPVNGWVYGDVTDTSIMVAVTAGGDILIEQYSSDMSQGESESGAPIFLHNPYPPNPNHDWLFGIAWGELLLTGDTLWSFYPNIEMELGNLSSCSRALC